MDDSNAPVGTTLRIPGNWSHPRELIERLPIGFRLTAESLFLPDDTEIEFFPMQPDAQFPHVFRMSCRRKAGDNELAIVDSYTVNIGLNGPCGSMEAALTMLQAGAAIVKAGGAGVFIDNSALAHGGRMWLEMADDGGPDAVSFAFVAIVRGEIDVWTVGMQVLGLPDIVMRTSDLDESGDTLVETIRYVSQSKTPIGDGHFLSDSFGPRFQAVATGCEKYEVGSPMHNPHGRLSLVSLKDVAEGN